MFMSTPNQLSGEVTGEIDPWWCRKVTGVRKPYLDPSIMSANNAGLLLTFLKSWTAFFATLNLAFGYPLV